MNIAIDFFTTDDALNGDFFAKKKMITDAYLVALADGMGGCSYPKLASDIVVKSVINEFSNNLLIKPTSTLFIDAFDHANQLILKKSYELHRKIGAALTVALFMNNTLYYCSSGDVRLYQKRGTQFRQLTHDDVSAYDNNILVSCLNGHAFRNELTVKQEILLHGDCYFLTTDGLYKQVSNDFLSNISIASLRCSNYMWRDDCSIAEIQIQ